MILIADLFYCVSIRILIFIEKSYRVKGIGFTGNMYK